MSWKYRLQRGHPHAARPSPGWFLAMPVGDRELRLLPHQGHEGVQALREGGAAAAALWRTFAMASRRTSWMVGIGRADG